jgi:putative membrane protein
MSQFFINWLLAIAAFMITVYVVPGFRVDSLLAGAIAATILGLINAIVRPILVILTFPVTILTLGLFLLVINALMIMMAGAISPGFYVSGFFPALIGSIVLTFVSWVLDLLFRVKKD